MGITEAVDNKTGEKRGSYKNSPRNHNSMYFEKHIADTSM